MMGKRNTEIVCLNGPAARKILIGDTIYNNFIRQYGLEKAKKYKPVQKVRIRSRHRKSRQLA